MRHSFHVKVHLHVFQKTLFNSIVRIQKIENIMADTAVKKDNLFIPVMFTSTVERLELTA
jgi:hypothetical protein